MIFTLPILYEENQIFSQHSNDEKLIRMSQSFFGFKLFTFFTIKKTETPL